MSEEENIAAELHEHLTHSLRTALAGGLQIVDQRARNRHAEAEIERQQATEVARQLEERKRAEREMNALRAQQILVSQEQDRADQAHQALEAQRVVDEQRAIDDQRALDGLGAGAEQRTGGVAEILASEHQLAGGHEGLGGSGTALDLDMDLNMELDLDLNQQLSTPGIQRG